MTQITTEKVVPTTPEFLLHEGRRIAEGNTALATIPAAAPTDAPEGNVLDGELWRAFRRERDARNDDPERAWSLSYLHKQTGISPSAWSKWIAGKPEGRVAKLEAVARKFMALELKREALPPMPAGFTETRVMTMLGKSVESIWYGGWFGLVSAPQGVGTTVALNAYARSRELPLLIRPTATRKNMYDVTSLLYDALTNRANERRRWKQRLEYVFDSIKGDPDHPEGGRLVIVDNAHLLDRGALRLFADLHVTNSVPVVLAGHPELAWRIADMPDLNYQVAPHVRLVGMHEDGAFFSEDEVAAIARRFVDGAGKTVVNKLIETANRHGHLVSLSFLLRQLQFFTRNGKSPLKALEIAQSQMLARK